MMAHMEKKTGMWKKSSKDGKEFWSGTIGDEQFLLFPNTFKTEGKHPDYNLIVKPKQAVPAAGLPALRQPNAQRPQPEPDDDLPF